MKLEPGKYYKTRDGRKAFISHVYDKEFSQEYEASGLLQIGTRWHKWEWEKRGWASLNEEEMPTDLVSEWTEPESQKVYIFKSLLSGKKRLFTLDGLPPNDGYWQRVGELEIQLDD